MSLLDAAWAIRQAMKVWDEAEDMVAAGAIGDVLLETIQHGMELLELADQEMEAADLARYRVLAAASPLLRAKLRVLRDRSVSPPPSRSLTQDLTLTHLRLARIPGSQGLGASSGGQRTTSNKK